MGGFAIELGEVFHLRELFDGLCSDHGDDRDECVEPRPIDLDVVVWLKVDGYVGVLVLVPYSQLLVPVQWGQRG